MKPDESYSHEDKHKAPALPRIRPLSLQDGDAPPLIPSFDCQHYQMRLPYQHVRLYNTIKRTATVKG